jgi:hypothetical protein
VTFFLNGKPMGAPIKVKSHFDFATGNLNAVATLSSSSLPEGANNIVATYTGDGNYLGSTSQPASVTVGKAAPACAVTTFTADPNPISLFDPPATTTINVNAACQVEVRIGSPKGTLLGSGTGSFSTTTKAPVKDGTTFYLQVQGDTTSKGTLQQLTVHVQAGSLPCVVYSFSATPNPIISPTLVGVTTITAIASCNYDIRVGSPNGGLLTSGHDAILAPTGPWVTNGMQFFLQAKGDLTPQGTLATLTAQVLASTPLCVVSNFSASPNPIVSPTGVGVTTIDVNAGCAFDVRLGSRDGPVFMSGALSISGPTGPWVTNGMTFYLQLHGDPTTKGTLGTLTVGVQKQ